MPGAILMPIGMAPSLATRPHDRTQGQGGSASGLIMRFEWQLALAVRAYLQQTLGREWDVLAGSQTPPVQTPPRRKKKDKTGHTPPSKATDPFPRPWVVLILPVSWRATLVAPKPRATEAPPSRKRPTPRA